MKGTPSSANKSTTPMKEEIPRMQLRSTTKKQRENEGNMCSGMHKKAKYILESPLSPKNAEDTQVTPTKK